MDLINHFRNAHFLSWKVKSFQKYFQWLQKVQKSSFWNNSEIILANLSGKTYFYQKCFCSKNSVLLQFWVFKKYDILVRTSVANIKTCICIGMSVRSKKVHLFKSPSHVHLVELYYTINFLLSKVVLPICYLQSIVKFSFVCFVLNCRNNFCPKI